MPNRMFDVALLSSAVLLGTVLTGGEVKIEDIMETAHDRLGISRSKIKVLHAVRLRDTIGPYDQIIWRGEPGDDGTGRTFRYVIA